MRTIIIILGGFLLLAACIGAARLIGGAATMSTAVKVFIPIWLVLAGINNVDRCCPGGLFGHRGVADLPAYILITRGSSAVHPVEVFIIKIHRQES